MKPLLCPLLDLGIHGFPNRRCTTIGRDQDIAIESRPVLTLDFDPFAALYSRGDPFGKEDLVGWDAGQEDVVELWTEHRQGVVAVSSSTYKCIIRRKKAGLNV